MTVDQLRAYHPKPNSQVLEEGAQEWKQIYQVPELMQIADPQTPPNGFNGPTMAPGSNVYQGQNVSGYYAAKDKTVCGLLALLVGTLGIQYFYLGKVTAGLLTILFSIISCGIYGIITFIQGIIILTMSEADFQRKFVNPAVSFPFF